jgi:hypothetical protein
MADEISQEFIGRQLALLLERLGSIEDQMIVQTAIIRRLDGAVSGLIDEVRGVIQAVYDRLDRRIRSVEER